VCRDDVGNEGEVSDPGCPGSLAEKPVEWLANRRHALNAAAQFGPLEGQIAALAELAELIDEARRRKEEHVLLGLLIAAAGAGVASTATGHRADQVIAELLDHARARGLWLHEVAAHTYLAGQEVFAGRTDSALHQLAVAQATLDQGGEPYPWLGESDGEWERALQSVLNSVSVVMGQLGMFENADPIMARTQRLQRAIGDPHLIAFGMLNRIWFLLSWGLRLERAGEREAAAERFRAAAAIATDVEGPWRSSQFPHRGRPAAERMPTVAAAHALVDPGSRHLAVLRGLYAETRLTSHRILLAVALARCHAGAGNVPAALRLLRGLSRQLAGDCSEPALAVSLAYELARLSTAGADKAAYVDALEAELWRVHKARLTTIRTRTDEQRLHDEQAVARRLALRDPLTGLPNRRALIEALGGAGNRRDWAPLAVALIDVDNFKVVNDAHSHARGDELLRAIATTLRDALREDDMVSRYGGDEFVVLLPYTTLAAAKATMQRTARAVAASPLARRHRITVSVGVTTHVPGECGDATIGRADIAMYAAKKHGGNRVHTSNPRMAIAGTRRNPTDG
jgi:diguanylate cyclase (GGDEF)-like protein